jgi:hypothetical protein
MSNSSNTTPSFYLGAQHKAHCIMDVYCSGSTGWKLLHNREATQQCGERLSFATKRRLKQIRQDLFIYPMWYGRDLKGLAQILLLPRWAITKQEIYAGKAEKGGITLRICDNTEPLVKSHISDRRTKQLRKQAGAAAGQTIGRLDLFWRHILVVTFGKLKPVLPFKLS